MEPDDTPTGFPSDTASLPPPPFLVWVLAVIVVTCVAYAGYYVFWQTVIGSSTTPGILHLIGQIATATGSDMSSIYADIRTVTTPHPISLLVLALLIFGYSYYSPYVWALTQWVWLTVTGKRIPDKTSQEGFLVSPPGNPGVTEWIITRRELLDNLRRRLFQLNPPHGIRCGTSEKPHAKYWKPSAKLIHMYVRRVAQMYPIAPDQAELRKSEKTANVEIRSLCEERAIIEEIITKMEIDATIQYTYRRAREHLQPLIAFYNRSRDSRRVVHPRRVVDNILGISLGQRDPYSEAEDNIVNAHRHILQTQTNDVQQLDVISNRKLRGGNDSEPVAPHLRMDS